MINQLKTNDTPLEYTITGLNLISAQISIMIQAAIANKSLKSLYMSRKGLTDKEGIPIANCLMNNKSLLQIDLEGNNLGVASAIQFGNLINTNDSLNVINLEGNDLTNHSDTNKGDISGIKRIAEVFTF